jgi:acetyl esterase/lipase
MMMLPREALDPEIREAVRDLPEFVFSAETVAMMRENAVFAPVAAPDIERTELTTGPDCGVGMTVLRPRDAVGDLPVLYWMHGGGMVIGNRYMDDSRLSEWCRSLSCICVSVEYRLAPEAPYPLPLDDCDEGLRYVVDHAGDLGINPRHIGIAGRSAGGGLAAALALRWRDRGDDHVAFQYLEYPMLDDRMNTPSSLLDGLPLGVANPTLSAAAPTSATAAGPLVGDYRTADNRWIVLAMLQPGRYWPEFCRRIGREDLITDGRFATVEALMGNTAEAAEILQGEIAGRTLSEWTSQFAGMEGQWGVAQDPWEVGQDPALRANGMIAEVLDIDGGRRELVANPVQFDETPASLTRAPQFAEHTDEILRGLGKSDDELIGLKISGAVT